MNNLSKKLAVLVGMVGFFSVCAMEDLPLAGNNLPELEQRQIALSVIGDFLLNQQEPKKLDYDDIVYTTDISTDSNHVVTGSLDFLNAPEFSQKGHPLAWMKDDISIFQAQLIARIYAVNQTGNSFILHTVTDFETLPATDDMFTWLTLPTYVRDYLMDHLKIKIDITRKGSC
ncbi:MAG TPA: hypothetical protein VJ201_01510 [Candidatus Babeliales bacterium]|nr:hypothetical protein [Candidatus Babeliales bacterium]